MTEVADQRPVELAPPPAPPAAADGQAGDTAVTQELTQPPAADSNGEPKHVIHDAPAGAPPANAPPVQQPASASAAEQSLPKMQQLSFAGANAQPSPVVPAMTMPAAPWYKRLCGACCGQPAAASIQGNDPLLPRAPTTSFLDRMRTVTTLPFAIDAQQGAPLGSGLPRRVSTFYTDADWFDAHSEFERTRTSLSQPGTPRIDELQATGSGEDAIDLQRMASEFQAMSQSRWAPDPPLDFADPNARFIQVPENTGFAGYWLSDPERTTPHPQPVDMMLNSSALAIKAHASIPGILITENATEMNMVAKPALMGGMIDYAERFTKDGKTTSWFKRRDLKAGHTFGQMYYTSDGVLIWRVEAKGLWGNAVEWLAEDHMRMEEDGQVLISRQCAKHVPSGKTASQYLVGRRITH